MISQGTWAVARHQLRLSWLALLLLGLVAGLSMGGGATALSVARRSATAFDRMREASGPADVRVIVTQDDELAGELLGSRPVRAAWRGVMGIAKLDAPGVVYVAVETGPPLPPTIATPVLSAGRLPDGATPDETLVSELFADALGLDVGDTITLDFLTADEVHQFDVGFGEPDGQRIDLTVTGIVRGVGGPAQVPVQPGPAFYARYGPSVGVGDALLLDIGDGSEHSASRDAFATALSTLLAESPREQTSGLAVADVRYLDDARAATAATARVVVAGLVVFAALLAMVATVAVAQGVTRVFAASASAQTIESALGLTRIERIAARLLAALPAVGVAAVVALVVGLAGGAVQPLGSLAAIEPHRGWSFHLPLSVLGAGVAVHLMVGAALLGAWRAGHLAARGPVTATTRSIAQLIGRVPDLVGGRLALASRRSGGRGAWPAILGLASGVAGIITVLTFATSVDRVERTPASWGFAADIAIIDATDEAVAQLRADPRVAAVADLYTGTVTFGSRAVPAHGSHDDVWTVLDGHRPHNDTEVMIGRRLQRRLGVEIGDLISMASGEVRVVGVGVGPPTSGEPLGSSALFTPGGLEAAASASAFREAFVTAATAQDRPSLVEDITARAEVSLPDPPPEVNNLRQLGGLPLLLVVLLSILALTGLVHALTSAAGQQQATLGVLPAVGFTPGQVVRTIVAMCSTIVVGGLAIGVPLGLGLGRVVWWAVADAIAIGARVSIPWGSVAVLIAVTLVASMAAAAIAARRSVPALGAVPQPGARGEVSPRGRRAPL